jgi:anti-sigma factor RsiW
MPDCHQVKLLLGPFDDAELEPHEMEDVALHVVTCQPCKAALNEYRSLGVALRDCLPQPNIDGFTSAVLKRIDQIPQPLWTRWRFYLDTIGERVGGTLSLMAAGAFAALVTAWLLTPYARHWLQRSSNLTAVASRNQDDITAPQVQTASVTSNASSDQSETSMFALSNDPNTTVIWLPNQP